MLSALFDPEASLTSSVLVDSTVSTCTTGAEAEQLKRLRDEELAALRLINLEHPETSQIHKAIRLLTDLIDREPCYAAEWNNRAQARRMLHQDSAFADNPAVVADIWMDLTRAVELATPRHLFGIVSSQDARVLASAHSHTGYLLFLASKPGLSETMFSATPLRGLSEEELEEKASHELQLGGRYGNKTARLLAV